MSDTDTATQPASPSLARLGAAGLGLLHSHLELASIELQEYKVHSLQSLAFTVLALFSGGLLLAGLSALLLIALWDDYRQQCLIGLCGIYTTLLLLSLWRLRKTLNKTCSPFQATLTELARDRERLLP